MMVAKLSGLLRSGLVRLHVSTHLHQPSKHLFHLPREIYLSILDFLPLESKILLRRTCRMLNDDLAKETIEEFEAMTRQKRFRVLYKVQKFLEHEFVCVECRGLHPIDEKDVPIRDLQYAGRPCDTQPCFSPRTYQRDDDKPSKYLIAPRHIQLAVKYSKNAVWNQNYLRALLQPYTETNDRSDIGIDATLTIRPKVVINRFIVYTKWVLHVHADPPPPRGFDFLWSQLCSKLKIYVKYADFATEEKVQVCPHCNLEDVVDAMDCVDSVWYMYCSICLTDFRATFNEEKRTCVVETLLDLGSGDMEEGLHLSYREGEEGRVQRYNGSSPDGRILMSSIWGTEGNDTVSNEENWREPNVFQLP